MDNQSKQQQAHALDKILPAILAVQSAAPTVSKGTDNPFFKSKYADLADIWSAIKESMAANNLIVTHLMEPRDGKEYLTTRIYHTSGQYLESVCPIEPVKRDPQGYGSAVTYMRRYSLSALLGIVTDMDDDGNDAAQAKSKKPEPKKEEPEVTQNPEFTQADYEFVVERLAKCHDLDGLDAIADYARKNWKRMAKSYQDLITKAINNKKVEIAGIVP